MAPVQQRQQQPRERAAGFPAGRYFGVPVFLSPSWLIFAAFITLSWADAVRQNVAGISTGVSYAIAFGAAVLLAISVLLHELGHCVVSLALGLPVRRIVLFLLGGVSEIEGEPERPSHEYLVAIAGPLVSLLIAGIGAAGYTHLPEFSVGRWLVFQLVITNGLVAAFNMLPGLPLDGGRVLRAGVWKLTGSQLTGTRAAAWGGRTVAIAVVVMAFYLQRDVSGLGLYSFAIGLLLAAFIWISAGQALRVATLKTSLPQLRVADLVRPTLDIATDVSIGEAVRRAQQAKVGALVVVDTTGKPRALVSETAVQTVPEGRRAWTSVADVARPLEDGLILRDTLAGEAMLDAMRTTPASEYLIVGRDGHSVGVLVTSDVAKALGSSTPQPSASGAPR